MAYSVSVMPVSQKHPKARIFVSLLLIAAWSFPVATGPVLAATPDLATLALDASQAPLGGSIQTPVSKVSLTVPAGALTQPANLKLVELQLEQSPLPKNTKLLSSYWVFDVKQTPASRLLQPVSIVLPYTPQGFGIRRVLIGTGTGWRRLAATDNTAANTMTVKTKFTYGQLIVVEDSAVLEGVASWYRDRRYPYGAAMNVVPLGSRVKVTNLENNKSVIVTIKSRGPYVDGRVVDLVSVAFSEIAKTTAGVARVRVTLVDTPPVVTSTPPKINSRAAVVMNASTQSVLMKKSDTVRRPIASLTKMMTALVVLDTNPDFNKLVTMTASDIPTPEPGARVHVRTGEKLRVKDLFYSMVTASANNAAYALARSTGLTRAQFVAKMNAKAKALGMKSTTFADPSGLDTRNVSTASDMAKLAAAAFANPKIRHAGSLSRYTFSEHTTVDGTIKHSVRHPLYLYNALLNNAPIETAKTGFLYEAGECVAFIAKNSAGKEYVVVLLGGTTATARANDANALIRWAAKQL